MNFRKVVSIYGSAAVAVGALLMGYGPMFLKYFGSLVPTDFGAYSLIRLAGVGFFLAGTLLLAVRTTRDSALQRRISWAMFAAHIPAALIVWAQQTAIWESPLGAAVEGWLWLAGMSFALVVIRRPQAASGVRV